MLPFDIPPGTTLESLIAEVIPDLHRRMVGEKGADDVFVIAVRIDGRGSWTIRIRGREMLVDQAEEPRPTLWMYTTQAAAERFLQDAVGPRRLLPKAPLGTVAMTDPRLVKRVAMASGRIELALVDDDGGRLAVVFGFGDAARRAIDPSDPDTVAEARLATLERVLRGERSPQEALSSGDVAVRGSRLLAMQLALAVAPFCSPTR
jgi:putative sterol carrier protein